MQCQPAHRDIPPPQLYLYRMEDAEKITIPEFHTLVNYPRLVGKRSEGGKKSCIMSGQSLRYCATSRKRRTESAPTISRGNRSVCTSREALVWEVMGTKIRIKWCKECTTFRPLAAFVGDKRMKKTCAQCLHLDKIRRKKTAVVEEQFESAALEGSASVGDSVVLKKWDQCV